MDYRIEIKDMENLQDPLILEYAERGTISLNWMGGDDKTQPLVGSELNFSMEVLGGTDGKYIQYFTSDEQKWQVTKYISDTDEIVWRGYLLPESYTEPWANPTFYPQFSAVDGLGLLKGKKLSDDFYSEEKTVIEIISACMQLTGIDFDLYFSPAIEHPDKKWHEILIDTRFYKDKPSAYEILEELISSLRCQLFQCQGRWYIEGVNKRQLETVTFYKYSITGEYLGAVDLSKNMKKVEWYPTPVIAMVPSYKEVNVTYETPGVSIPEDVYKEQDINWRPALRQTLDILPENWNYNPSFLPVMKAPEYFLQLPSVDYSPPSSAHVSLKEKLYVLKGEAIKVSMAFQFVGFYRSTQTDLDDDELSVFPRFEFELNGVRVASNVNSDNPETAINYNNDRAGKCSFYIYPSEDGFLDVKIFTPSDSDPDYIFEGIRLEKLEIEIPSREDEAVISKTIAPKSSQVKDIDLKISDNINGFSKCFYLDKQRDYASTYFTIEVPILYSFAQNGKNYHVVSLKHAHLIEQYKAYVHHTNPYEYLENLEVIYNLNGGEQMVVVADTLMSGKFYVTVRPYKEPTADRNNWLRWYDSTAKIGEKRYAEIVSEIEEKLFSDPHLRIEGAAATPVKYNDIIQFSYRGEKKYFVPTNVSWNPDENESNLTLIEGIYAGNSLGNIPPFIDAGPDIYIDENATSAQITEAVAYDPDGQIDKLKWSLVSGTGTFSNDSVLNPKISSITGEESEFRLTGTDRKGISSSDTMKVFRVGQYLLVLTRTFYELQQPEDYSLGGEIYKKEIYKLTVDPALSPEETITFNFDAEAFHSSGAISWAKIVITKQNNEIYRFEFPAYPYAGGTVDKSQYNTLNYIEGDEIEIVMEASLSVHDFNNQDDEVWININFNEADFMVKKATVSNLPQIREVGIQYSSYGQ